MSTEESDQVVQRRANLDALRALGIDVYPRRYETSETIEAAVAAHEGKTGETLEAEQPRVRVAGRILARRTFGKANFLVLSDGRARVQVYLRQDSMPALDFRIYTLLDLGDHTVGDAEQIFARLGCDEIVFVFRVDEQLDTRVIFAG